MRTIARQGLLALVLMIGAAAPVVASERADEPAGLSARPTIAEAPAPSAPRLAGPACHSDCMLKHAMCRDACLNGAEAAACISSRCEPVQRQCSVLCMPQDDRFAMTCLDRDRAAVALLEEQGVLLQIGAEQLSQAHGTLLNARAECARGELDEALALYERIVPILRGDDRQGEQAGIPEPRVQQ